MRVAVRIGLVALAAGLTGCGSCAGDEPTAPAAPARALGAADPETLAATLVDALKSGDEAAYAAAREGAFTEEDRAAFHALRQRALDHGVDWPNVRLDRTAFQIREDDGVLTTSLSLVLDQTGHVLRLWIDGARKTEHGWFATAGLRWSFGPLDHLLGHWTVDAARLPPPVQPRARPLEADMDVHIRVGQIHIQAAGRDEASTFQFKETAADGGAVVAVTSKGQTADVTFTTDGDGLRMRVGGRLIPLRRK